MKSIEQTEKIQEKENRKKQKKKKKKRKEKEKKSEITRNKVQDEGERNSSQWTTIRPHKTITRIRVKKTEVNYVQVDECLLRRWRGHCFVFEDDEILLTWRENVEIVNG